jgi:Flp pilus assembly pilin Flp
MIHRPLPRRLRRRLAALRRLHRDRRGATMLEWALLLAAIAIPSYLIILVGMATLRGHYQLIITLHELPFP